MMNFAMLILMGHIGALNAFKSKTEKVRYLFRSVLLNNWLVIKYKFYNIHGSLSHFPGRFSNSPRRRENVATVAVISMPLRKSHLPVPKKTMVSRNEDLAATQSGRSIRTTSTSPTTNLSSPNCPKRWLKRSRRIRRPKRRRPRRPSEKSLKIPLSLKTERPFLRKLWTNLSLGQTTLLL